MNDESLPRFEKIPDHIAFIMDGNGRWAQKEGNLDRIIGHEKGASKIHDIVILADDLGVKYMTFFTFSTENWSRPRSEVEFILSELLVKYLEFELDFMQERNIKFNYIGETSEIPQLTQDALKNVKELTRENTGMKVTLAVNYGGRREIIEAVKKVAMKAVENPGIIDGLDKDSFRSYFYDPELPDPDILIRTGGEMRLSNFCLWQLSYSELYMTETLWPDFGPEDLTKALEEFNGRDRRFGGLNS